MNENINLCEILKNCPKGIKLYSSVLGEVEFDRITLDSVCPIKVIYDNSFVKGNCSCFTRDGRFLSSSINSECVLFPSKEQRDWSKWQCPKLKFDPKTLNPFDKVLVRNGFLACWECDLFSSKNNTVDFEFMCIGNSHRYCIPYNNSTKHLVGTSEEAPEYYKYWED